ncbi:hypothetical protein HQ325_16985 [Rhodococcus sp. BP-349]|uniref:DNA gyrase subunit A n=1 Tax=unclassified Rhodococcus (in: high G+C Gram-positive bacteria) TaxID=192944 RepID=UPI001C9B51D2|nr:MULTISPECIES: DNA gyrase subunit A [unclassified Rhodococcus (in: high G+C Gram-positive bacteria)]MBY6540372.1 hypothetical protein [Rhodococcus sp. BP-363]MBY6545603.1 hypothetical protein [Rhodococcus sp. BP-369]MBY6564833.1 hypothetical protein [Rhodococcus sp. BP-370]MBY6578231.1 hypothetical protein [Rhodococcus sp. BP-364]MBY6587532.1 hypothetical protein [Rhodococcus sp. BP-358]
MTNNDGRRAERLSILRALAVCLDNTAEVLGLVAESEGDDDAVHSLTTRFGFDRLQARAILAMQVRRFSRTEKAILNSEIAAMETEAEGQLAVETSPSET